VAILQVFRLRLTNQPKPIGIKTALKDPKQIEQTIPLVIFEPLVGTGRKKSRRVRTPKVFHRVGLLPNEPPGTGRAAFYLVFRSMLRLTNLIESISTLVTVHDFEKIAIPMFCLFHNYFDKIRVKTGITSTQNAKNFDSISPAGVDEQ